jgi:hypothetical protein
MPGTKHLHFSPIKNNPLYTLAKRIKELYEDNQNEVISVEPKEFKKFVRQVVETRNAFTHSEKHEKKTLQGKDLYLPTTKIRSMRYCCILKKIGIQENQYIEGLRKCSME